MTPKLLFLLSESPYGGGIKSTRQGEVSKEENTVQMVQMHGHFEYIICPKKSWIVWLSKGT